MMLLLRTSDRKAMSLSDAPTARSKLGELRLSHTMSKAAATHGQGNVENQNSHETMIQKHEKWGSS